MGAPRGDLRERVRQVPGMERLLPALEGLEPAYLVGGAVRDLLRGAAATDIDIAVEGDARSVARAVAERLGGEAREYERFGTATVQAPSTHFDLATTRTETYDEPGALPRVRRGGARVTTCGGATSRSTRWRWGSAATTSATSTTPRRTRRPGAGLMRVLH